MARGKKTGGRNFVPGVVTNPNGRPRIPQDLKLAREAHKHLVESKIYELKQHSKEELKELAKNASTDALTAALATIIVKAIEGGDTQRLNFLLDRTIGPVPKNVNVDAKVAMSHEEFVGGSFEGE